jgi:transcriptional regulator GlxA family with amidase domain
MIHGARMLSALDGVGWYESGPGGAERPTVIPPVVAGVLNHMDRFSAEPLGIEELAARFGLSASHLHALFRQHVGRTPHQHLILQRMRAARHRLVATREPIKSIARDFGYANTENFCRAFRQHCGMTTAAYRRTFTPYQ